LFHNANTTTIYKCLRMALMYKTYLLQIVGIRESEELIVLQLTLWTLRGAPWRYPDINHLNREFKTKNLLL
jgi:hypothetical protein